MIYVDAVTYELVPSGESPNGVIALFANNVGGMLDAYVRADDLATFEAGALDRGLTYEETVKVVDPETGEVTYEKTGEIAMGTGVEFSRLGSVVIVPAEVDEDGNEITPAVMDNRYHVNIRLHGWALEKPDEVLPMPEYLATLIMWSEYGVNDEQINNVEQGKVIGGISLLNPDSFTAKRVWL